ncbi:MAG: efflux RND transporter periplasmic adaptor subunit [Planctomycetota bacterium]|nr:efflux RND transporter periplasmic adaptor subunit [Planctomycetota bacterium]
MKDLPLILGGIVVLSLGVGGTFLADHYGLLPGLESQLDKPAEGCPHSLPLKTCPFCDESLIIKKGECVEHGVPEALCYLCRSALIPAFKANNDWCGGHSVPESQCYDCNPELLRSGSFEKERLTGDLWTASAEDGQARSKRPPAIGCRTHTLKVNLKSTRIAEQIGLAYSPVIVRAVSHTLVCNAEISYDKRRFARLSPRVPGIVKVIKKDLGETVKKGEVVAILYSIDLAMAKTSFLKFSENVKTAKLKLDQAKATFERWNQMELRLAAVEYLKAQELHDIARRNFEREEKLLKSKATSSQDVLSAQAKALRTSANVKALRKKLLIFGLTPEFLKLLNWNNINSIQGRSTTSAQPYLLAQMALRSAQADRDSARQRLESLGLIQADVQAVLTNQNVSGELPIYAPFSGVLVKRHAVVGESVKTGELLFSLADTSKMWAMLDIEEENMAQVKTGLPVILQVQGLKGVKVHGQLTWLDTQIDDKTRVLRARAEFDNSDGMLRANMFAQARILLRQEEKSMLVPRAAVQWEGCCNIVFVKLNDRVFEPRKVLLAFQKGNHAVIDKGLVGDEVIVTTGSFLLKTEILKGNIGAGCCGD